MLFSLNWLKNYLATDKTPEQLAELLANKAFEIEQVKKQGQDYLLDIKVLHNRSFDCLSHLGLARELAAIGGGRLKTDLANLPKAEFRSDPGSKLVDIKIVDSQLAPYYCALVLDNIVAGPSPAWLEKALAAVGLHTINNIVDITNYIMLELGQPMHAFALAKIKNGQMIIRPAQTGEKIATLDGGQNQLKKGMLVIQDGQGQLIDLAGIMGGALSEIDSATKSIVLQAAIFDRTLIRQTTRALGKQTPASALYSQGVNPNLCWLALQRAVYLMAKAGLKPVVEQTIKLGQLSQLKKVIKLEPKKLANVLGLKMPLNTAKKILTALGCQAEIKSSALIVEPPVGRNDLVLPEDLIEEIGRIYGYEKIKAKMPKACLQAPKINAQSKISTRLRNSLTASQFSEVYNYSFIGPDDLGDDEQPELFVLENYTAQDLSILRPCLRAGLLRNISQNCYKKPVLKFFELGDVFYQQEKSRLGLVVFAGSQDYYYDLKGALEDLCQSLGIVEAGFNYQIEIIDRAWQFFTNSLVKDSLLELKFGHKSGGYLGEVKPAIADKYDIKKGRVFLAELDLDILRQQAQEQRLYQKPSKYPLAGRDLSLLVPSVIKTAQVLNVLNEAGGKLLKDVDLFDFYQGVNTGQAQKSLSFHLLFQANSKTLTRQEVNKLMEKIITAIQEQGWEVRKVKSYLKK